MRTKKVLVSLNIEGHISDSALVFHIRDILRRGLSTKKVGLSNVEVFANHLTPVEEASLALADAILTTAEDEACRVAERLNDR